MDVYLILTVDGKCKYLLSNIISCRAHKPTTYVKGRSTIQVFIGGIDLKSFLANLTISNIFINPKPKSRLTKNPAAFLYQPGFSARGATSLVHTNMCCTSLQVSSGLEK